MSKKILLGLGIAVLLGLGLYWFLAPSGPDAIVRKALSNALELESVAFEGTAQLKAEEIKDLSGSAEIKLAGKINKIAELIPDLDYTLAVSGNLTANNQKMDGAGTLEIRFVGKKPYLRISKITLPKELAPQIEPLLVQFKDKWFALPFDAAVAEKSTNKKEAELLEEIKDLVKKYEFVTVEQDLGITDNQYHFLGKLNGTAIRQFAEAAAKKTGEQLKAEDLTTLEQLIEKLAAKIELWIGMDDLQIHRESGVITLTDPTGKEPGRLTLDFDITIKDHDKEQVIEAPTSAIPFDPKTLLGQ